MNLNDILHALIQEYGREVLRERGRVLGLVADWHPTRKREHRLLKVLYEADIVEELLRDSGDHAQRRAVRKLVDEFVVDAGAAEEAIQAVCMALGYPVSEPVLSVASVSVPQVSAMLIDERYLDHGDGTVTDTHTGLQWMRCLLGQKWDGKKAVGEEIRYTYDETKAAAKLCRFAGYQDWRVPSIDELKSIIERRRFSAINSAAFPETPNTIVWSASSYPRDDRHHDIYKDFRYYVNFRNGHAACQDKVNHHSVWLVRSGAWARLGGLASDAQA